MNKGINIQLPFNLGDTVCWLTHFGKQTSYGTVYAITYDKFGFNLGISISDGRTVQKSAEDVSLYERKLENE